MTEAENDFDGTLSRRGFGTKQSLWFGGSNARRHFGCITLVDRACGMEVQCNVSMNSSDIRMYAEP